MAIIYRVWRLKSNPDDRLINFFLWKKAINDAGSAENIKVWCYPTPQQRLIFSEPKLILLGAWGTGKTLFMIAESIRLAELGQKVLFLLFSSKEQNSSSKKVGFFYEFDWLSQDETKITFAKTWHFQKMTNVFDKNDPDWREIEFQ